MWKIYTGNDQIPFSLGNYSEASALRGKVQDCTRLSLVKSIVSGKKSSGLSYLKWNKDSAYNI